MLLAMPSRCRLMKVNSCTENFTRVGIGMGVGFLGVLKWEQTIDFLCLVLAIGKTHTLYFP